MSFLGAAASRRSPAHNSPRNSGTAAAAQAAAPPRAAAIPDQATRDSAVGAGAPAPLRVVLKTCALGMLRVSLQVLPRIQLTDPSHPRFGGTQVRS